MASLRAPVAIALLAATLFTRASAAPEPPTAQQIVQRVPMFDDLQAWLRLVRRHTVGVIDDAARDAVKMPPVLQQRLIDDLQLLRLLVLQAGRQGLVQSSSSSSGGRSATAELRGKRLGLEQLAPLLSLSPEETGGPITVTAISEPASPARRAIAQLMIRAALLHTDIAMAPASELPPPPAVGPRLAQTAVELNDGRETQVLSVAIHYAIAREAVALVMPATAGSYAARQWYLATLAFMQGNRKYDSLLPHLDTARIALAADSRVWLWSGAAHENVAAPPLQVAAGVTSARLESPTLLRARAESFYRRALELDPACAECWLRLARVHQLSGQMEEAAVLLARAEPKLTMPVHRYYAALFAGRSAEALGKIPEARAAYERAMGLFPRAQSPRLALADLAFRDTQAGQALSGVRAMFVTSDPTGSGDPWWEYDISLVLNWPDLVREMRKSALALVEQK